MARPVEPTDPEIVRAVRVSDALRRRYRRNAEPYSQARLAATLGVPQSAISKVLGGVPTEQVTEKDKVWIHEMTERRQYWVAKARQYRPQAVWTRLGIDINRYYKAVPRRTFCGKKVPEGLVASFLTGRLT